MLRPLLVPIGLLCAFTACERDLDLPSGPQQGNVAGIVDTGGHIPLAGNDVVLVWSDGTKSTQQTASDGSFTFSALPPGSYYINLALPGFAPFTYPSVGVTAGQTTDVGTLSPTWLAFTSDASEVTGLVVVMGAASADLSAGHVDFVLEPVNQVVARTPLAADGSYVQSVPPGVYNLIAYHPLYVSAQLQGVAVQAGTNLDLTSTPIALGLNPATLKGSVLKEVDGSQPVGAATALVTLDDGSTTTTDVSGNFTLGGLAAATEQVRFALAGYHDDGSHVVTLTPGNTTTVPPVTLALDRGAVAGVVSATGAASQAGTQVLLMGTSYLGVTDTHGSFSLTGVPAGSYSAVVSRPGYASWTSTSFNVTLNATTSLSTLASPIALAVDDSASIVGTCTATGAPSQDGNAVSVTGADFNGAPVSGNALTSGGMFALSGLPAGTFTVSCSRAGFSPASSGPLVLVQGQAQTGEVLTLAVATTLVTGSVALGAGGLGGFTPNASSSGVAVTLVAGTQTFTTVSGAGGAFSFPAVPFSISGTPYPVTASMAGYLNAGTNVTVVPPGPPSPVAMTLGGAPSTVTGTVTVPAPAPNSGGVTVQLTGTAFDQTAFSTSGTSSATGAYSLSNVPAGSYTLTFTRAGFLAGTGGATVPPPPGTGGPPAVAGPNVTLARATGGITGTVVFATGGTLPSLTPTDLAGAVISVTEPAGSDLTGTGPWVTTTDTTGSFSLPGIPVSPSGAAYTVTASKANFIASGTASTSLVAGQNVTVSGLQLTVNAASLPVTAELHDFVNCPACTQVAYGAVSVSVTGTAFDGQAVSPSAQITNGSGVATFSTLPPGTYAVTATFAGHSTGSQNGLSLVAGQSTPLTLKLFDLVPPSTPVLASSHKSPTSSLTTAISISQASTDTTQPTPNFAPAASPAQGTYQWRVCNPGCSAWTNWTGATAVTATLVSGVDNNVFVQATDAAGNAGQPAVLTVHCETQLPNPAQNVHVDNRPSAARITWSPPAPNNGSSYPNPAGYRVYYGPVSSTTLSDYNGTFAAEGSSPIDVGSATQLVLDGLPNASPFYAMVVPYDAVVDPGPNLANPATSPISVVAPDTSPFDFAGRTNVGATANSFAVLRDLVFVSTGTAGNYTITSYAYDAYGTMTALGTVAAPDAKMLVADENDVLIGYDPGGTGLDVIDVNSPVVMNVLASHVNAALQFLKIFPVHRTMSDGYSHTVAIYTSGANTYAATMWWAAADHRQIYNYGGSTLDSDAVVLGGGASAAALAQLAWPYLVVSGGGQTYDFYYVNPSPSTAIAYAGNFIITGAVGCGNGGQIALDWPNIYVTCSSVTTTVVWTGVTSAVGSSVSTGAPVALNFAPQHVITKMVVQGDTLFAAEDQGSGRAAVEAVTGLAATGATTAPTLSSAGTYTLQQANSLNGAASTTADIQFYGTNMFALLQSTPPGTAGAVDVVELGGPHSIVQAGRENLIGTTPYSFASTFARGSKVYATTFDAINSGLVRYDLAKDFGPGTVSSLDFSASCGTGCGPIATDGDYAYLVSPANTIQIIDLGAATWPGSLVSTLAAAGTVTGLAVANDYLLATVAGTGTPYLQVWNIQGRAAPAEVTPRVANASGWNGQGLDVQGHLAYVGTSGSLCVVDFLSTPNTLVLKGCDTTQDAFQVGAAAGVKAGTTYQNRIYAATNGGSGSLPVADVAYTYDPGLNALVVTSQTFEEVAPPGPLVRSGPYLYQLDTPASGLQYAPPLLGYDVSGASPAVAGSFTNLQAPQMTPFGWVGPLVVVPDATEGLVLLRLY